MYRCRCTCFILGNTNTQNNNSTKCPVLLASCAGIPGSPTDLVLEILHHIRADSLNAVYFRGGLMCILGLTNDYQDNGQLRAKPYLHTCKVKPNHILKPIFSPS